MTRVPPDRLEAVRLGAYFADDPESLAATMHEYSVSGHRDMALWMRDAYAAVVVAEYILDSESDALAREVHQVTNEALFVVLSEMDRIDLVGMHAMNSDEKETDDMGKHSKTRERRGRGSQRDVILAMCAVVSIAATAAAFSRGAWIAGVVWGVVVSVGAYKVVRSRRNEGRDES